MPTIAAPRFMSAATSNIEVMLRRKGASLLSGAMSTALPAAPPVPTQSARQSTQS